MAAAAVRAARMIKSITFVRELRLIVASILCSLSSLLWALVLLTFVVYLFSIFLMQSIEVHSLMVGENPGGALMEMYGTLPDSMFTLFCAISGGRDWAELVSPFDAISRLYRYIFVSYVIFVFFGVLNILTAIFVESAKRIAEIDREIVIQDQITRDQSTMNEVRRIFMIADSDGDGRLSLKELEAVLLEAEKTSKNADDVQSAPVINKSMTSQSTVTFHCEDIEIRDDPEPQGGPGPRSSVEGVGPPGLAHLLLLLWRDCMQRRVLQGRCACCRRMRAIGGRWGELHTAGARRCAHPHLRNGEGRPPTCGGLPQQRRGVGW